MSIPTVCKQSERERGRTDWTDRRANNLSLSLSLFLSFALYLPAKNPSKNPCKNQTFGWFLASPGGSWRLVAAHFDLLGPTLDILAVFVLRAAENEHLLAARGGAFLTSWATFWTSLGPFWASWQCSF